jgi:type IX secretion system PorP/SprF family membrane protein
MKKFVRIASFLIMAVLAQQVAIAQEFGNFSQFYLNRFHFNPSYAAHQGFSEVSLMYRQQWLGIENAPKSVALNAQATVGRNVSLGFSLINSKTILLNQTSLLPVFAYRARLGNYHHLNFGLAAGVTMNNFDLDAIANAGNDPALANMTEKNFYASAQAGINYQYKNLNIGVALPKLLASKTNSSETFQNVKFSRFENKFASISYNIILNRDIQLSPQLLYRASDLRQHLLEMMAVATYRNIFWIGASYANEYGLTGFVGLRARNLLRVGYAYTRPTGKLSAATMGSHEIFAGARIGKKDREEAYMKEKNTKDSLAQVATHHAVTLKKDTVSTTPQPLAGQPIVTPLPPEEKAVMKDTVTVHVITNPSIEERKKDEPVYKGYYVVVGAFNHYSNALKDIRILKERGLYPEMFYLLRTNFYYVYLYHSDNRADAMKELHKVHSKFQNAWLFNPEHK